MYQFLRKLTATPIFLFQMGKVGSSSLRSTLSDNYDGIVAYAHNYQMFTAKEKNVLQWRKRLKLPIYVICPVREPISRNISAFFQNFKRDTGYEFTDQQWTVDELVDMFLEHYPHNVCLEWFDRNLRTTFGVDIFSEPFPTDQKWKTYKHRSFRILVYRSDLGHFDQLDLISRFIGCKIVKWAYSNISNDKDYGETYKMFIDSVKLPDIYISIMCNSRFCRQFWSKEEIDTIVRRWKG